MGLDISSVLCKPFRRTPKRVLMMGLGRTGKTTILYRLKLGETIATIPTIGFNQETVEYKNISFIIWDIPGSKDRIKPLWRHYYPNTDGIIFVVDSTADRDDIEESLEDLHHWILGADELRDCVLLVFANKQDLPNAMSTDELTDKLKLNTLKDRSWYVQEACATQGTGLYEGLEWLANELSKK